MISNKLILIWVDPSGGSARHLAWKRILSNEI